MNNPETFLDAVLAETGRSQLFPGEREAIISAIQGGMRFGFGNLIAWLQTAWVVSLESQGLDRKTAIEHTMNRTPYPLPPNPK